MGSKSKDAVYTRREVEALIADGRTIFVLDGYLIKADAWLPYHPGGDKSIKHMVGRDATDEVNALHSTEAKERMKSYRMGRIEGRWTNFVPPIQGGKFRKLFPEESSELDNTVDISEAEESTLESSEEPSPIFEPVEAPPTGSPYQRKGTKLIQSQPSSASISSIDLDDTAVEPKLSHFDARTLEEIELDLSKYPSLAPEVQDDIVQKYRALEKRIREEGLYQCPYYAYYLECCSYVALFALSMIFLRYGWYTTSGIFLGFLWHQLVFTAHDAGHIGITHNFHVDTVIGIIIADFCGGLSIGWWKRSHNVHHIVTNSPEHDPDIEHLPFFAISHRFFKSLRSSYYDRVMAYDGFARFLIPYQHFLYYIILAFGRFNLYRLSFEYLLGGQAPRKGPAWWHRWLELVGQAFFWTWFGYGIVYKAIPTTSGRLAFVLASHIASSPLHVQITLSHFAMSTADLGQGESFPQKMLRTTMDVDCPRWLDFFHGGLQFQAVHHLYPRIPRHNLRRTQNLVIDFCKDVGIPYAIYGFARGNGVVLGRMADIGRQAKIFAECQRVVATSEDLGMH
ncbi:fatty acid desaturase-domain-containing protein [Lineolata rhizophorae]|uniref:Delta 8-(E)-sphingolipid desaturase n=1 Tax=Lineolata rhizophorae TaxID=578093 RepID=A0A6A6P0E8_9PEZI|nr:fatty acid desaturase-domain-containing protein [Lineolata rhizophorae]